VDLTAGVDIVEKKISCPCQDSNPGCPVLAHPYTDSYLDSYVSKIMLKWILKMEDMKAWIVFNGLGYGSLASSFKHRDKYSC
jgi:hypothetical protein